MTETTTRPPNYPPNLPWPPPTPKATFGIDPSKLPPGYFQPGYATSGGGGEAAPDKTIPGGGILSVQKTGGEDKYIVRTQIPGADPGVYKQTIMTGEQVKSAGGEIPISGTWGQGAGTKWAPPETPTIESEARREAHKYDIPEELKDYPASIKQAYTDAIRDGKDINQAVNQAIVEYNEYVKRTGESQKANDVKYEQEEKQFQEELKKDDPYLYKVYMEGGTDAYNAAVKKRVKDIGDIVKRSEKRFLEELSKQPQELQEAFKKGGYDEYNKARLEYNAKIESEYLEYDRAAADLESYKDSEGYYDTSKYLRDHPGEENNIKLLFDNPEEVLTNAKDYNYKYLGIGMPKHKSRGDFINEYYKEKGWDYLADISTNLIAPSVDASKLMEAKNRINEASEAYNEEYSPPMDYATFERAYFDDKGWKTIDEFKAEPEPPLIKPGMIRPELMARSKEVKEIEKHQLEALKEYINRFGSSPFISQSIGNIADVVIPGLYLAKNWQTMPLKEKILNISLDVIFIASIFGKPLGAATRQAYIATQRSLGYDGIKLIDGISKRLKEAAINNDIILGKVEARNMINLGNKMKASNIPGGDSLISRGELLLQETENIFKLNKVESSVKYAESFDQIISELKGALKREGGFYNYADIKRQAEIIIEKRWGKLTDKLPEHIKKRPQSEILDYLRQRYTKEDIKTLFGKEDLDQLLSRDVVEDELKAEAKALERESEEFGRGKEAERDKALQDRINELKAKRELEELRKKQGVKTAELPITKEEAAGLSERDIREIFEKVGDDHSAFLKEAQKKRFWKDMERQIEDSKQKERDKALQDRINEIKQYNKSVKKLKQRKQKAILKQKSIKREPRHKIKASAKLRKSSAQKKQLFQKKYERLLTREKQRAKTETKPLQVIKTETMTEAAPKIASEQKTATKTQVQEKQAVKAKEKEQTKLLPKDITKEIAITKPAENIKGKQREQIKPVEKTRRKEIPPKLIPIRQSDRNKKKKSVWPKTQKEKRQAVLSAGGMAVAYQRGELKGKDVWHVWYQRPDNKQLERVILIGKVPQGAQVEDGPKSAYRSIQSLFGRGRNRRVIVEDTGAVDTTIEIGGKTPQISFVKDTISQGQQRITGRDDRITEKPPRIS